MFYEPKDGHGLPHNPLAAIISPRPIGWISTRSAEGADNLAPYSFFNAAAYAPPQVQYCSTGTKDSLNNARATGFFCVSIVGTAMTEVMNQTSASLPHGEDEFLFAGIKKAECRTIPCTRVAEAPAALECRVTQIVRLLGRDNHMVLGEVLGVHLRDDCLVDGYLDVRRYSPVARLGYKDYTRVETVFSMTRPDED